MLDEPVIIGDGAIQIALLHVDLSALHISGRFVIEFDRVIELGNRAVEIALRFLLTGAS